MRKNNFDIVRLILAVAVVLIHSIDLSNEPALAPMRVFLSHHLPVEGFFAISGYLIFASYERTSSLREYTINRALRILPGYWLSTVFCLAIAFSMGCFHVGKFLLANLTFANFLSPSIPGVFETNPASHMNGALWTIKVEVMFYIAVPIIVWLCRRLHRDAVLVTLFFASIAFRIAFANNDKVAVQLPGQLSFFLVGTLIFYHLDFFRKHGKLLSVLAAISYGLHVWTGWFILRPAAIGILIIAACILLPQIKGPTRWGDFSYGTYILHWPIIQLLVAAGLFAASPWLAVLATLLLVFAAAALSWFFVEKPALAHAPSRRMRNAAMGTTPNFPPAVP